MMKRFLSILLTAAFCCVATAQEVRSNDLPADSAAITGTAPEQEIIGGADAPTHIYTYDGYRGEPLAANDSLHLPVLDGFGRTYINMYPYSWYGMFNWQLHKGLNLNLGASVFASFGDSYWKGVGFTQSMAAMYAVPLTDKLSLAVGGYINNLFWARDTYHDAGLNAVLGYKFDEHWEGYIFGQKSLVNTRMPLPLYDIGNIGDRIGAAIKYNFNSSFSIQVSVSAEKRR